MAIGEAALGAFLQVVFDKLVFSPGVKKFLKLWGGGNLDATMKQWKCQLQRFREMADDAEEKQFYNDRVKTWVDDIRDLAYDIEDILDDFAEEAQSHESNNTQEDDADDPGFFGPINNMLGNIPDTLSTMLSPINPDIQSRVDDITVRLQDIQTRTQNLGLMAAYTIQQQTLQAEAFRKRRESTSLVAEPEVFGRDKQKEHIITQLLKDEQSWDNYVVVPIVGQGGIGKTTLAQYVYNDEQVKSHFEIKAWVCVSDVFDVKRITTTIINSVDGSKFDSSDLNLAQEKLSQLLTDRRFFIVLDDIWSENYDDWSQLRTPFRYGAKGSRVVMTTRNEKIACMMVTKHISINTLNGLSSDDCWHIFQQHTNEDTDLAEMREDIVQKCNGLPLAAKALAGLLRKKSKSECRRILNSNIWSEKSSVLPVLRLSYHHLPSRVKCCFAYCSVLPKDYLFEEMEIIKLWMAQGFLTDKSERMEDIGHDIFRDLVSISLFEKHKYDNMELFTMHDLIHDLAKWAAGSLCCVTDTIHLQKDVERTRHLCVTANGIDEILGTQLSASPLRTFLCGKNTDLDVEILDYIPKFRYLRTLRLVSGKIKELPKSIGDFKHLQFLELRLYNIKVLPKSIGKLTSLRTLHVVILDKGYKIEEFPDVSNLLELSHLFFGPDTIRRNVCNQFVLAAGGGSRIRDLKKLNKLHGRLEIYGVGNVIKAEDAQEAQLHKKTSLEELCLYWESVDVEELCLYWEHVDVSGRYWESVGVGDDDNTAKDVLEQLKPHTFIRKYGLSGYKGLTLPCWLGDPSFQNIVDIRLDRCMRCECFPSLGQLPSLKSLFVRSMDGIKEVGLEFYGDCSTPPFPALTSLELSYMYSWEKWEHSPVDNNRAFSCLEELKIYRCWSLQKDIPPHLPALKELYIEGCKEMSVSLPSLPSLEKLVINGCKELSTMADVNFCPGKISEMEIEQPVQEWGLHLCNSLEILDLRNVESLECVPCPGFSLPCTLVTLTIMNFQNLRSIASHGTLSNLTQLMIYECPNLESLFDENVVLTSLEYLQLENCPNLKFLPGHLPSLQKLNIERCKGMSVLLQTLPSSLKEVTVIGCKKMSTTADVSFCSGSIWLENISEMVGFPCLGEQLKIVNCESLITCEPGRLTQSSSLKTIEFRQCENMESLPSQLHHFSSLQKLRIEECPKIKCFPEGGLPKNLTHLYIREMKIEQPVQEWGLHLCNSLKILEIREMKIEQPVQEWGLHLNLLNVGSSTVSLECIPCFSLPGSLDTLRIKNFQNLKSIASHGTLSNLTLVMIHGCPNLESLFDENVVLTSLKSLQLENCPNLKFLPGHLPSLQKLNIERCKGMSVLLQTLPSSLKEVDIIGCADVSFCSGSIWLGNISKMVGFPCLGEQLKIVNCESLITCEPGRLTQLSSLKTIRFWQCENMESLPSQLHHFSSLQTLTIAECPKIKCFPEGGLPKNLTHLEICEMKIEQPVQEWGLDHCESLKTLNLLNVGSCTESLECIPCPGSLDTLRIKNFQNLKSIASHGTLSNLTLLMIYECPKLESLFDENVVLTSLRSLFDESLFDEHAVLAYLRSLQLKNCPNLKFLSGQFTSLGKLFIENCLELRSFPKACLSQKLRWLRISTASIETPIKEWGLHLLTSLEVLEIEDVGNSSDTLECTTELHLPSSLSEFYIKGFKNLKTIPCSTLPKLRYLSIKCCPKFESFGDNGLPSQLEYVSIEECELIQQKLKRDPKGRIHMNYGTYSFC